MTRVLRADCRSQFGYSDRCRACHRQIRDQHADDCPRQHQTGARFYTGTKYVTWGEATIEQHLERIAYLSKLQSGITDTIARHQHAVDVLVDAGADCLNHVTDLEPPVHQGDLAP